MPTGDAYTIVQMDRPAELCDGKSAGNQDRRSGRQDLVPRRDCPRPEHPKERV